MARAAISPFVCARCARNLPSRALPSHSSRLRKTYATKAAGDSTGDNIDRDSDEYDDADSKPEPGPMARRLEEATEEALLTGGQAGRRAVEDAGFSDELKERLFAKVKDAQFRSDHASAFAEADMPTSAGTGTRSTAAAQPWTGQETTEDAVLRMLNDVHKPLNRELRGRPKISDLRPVDMRIKPQPKMSAGHRAASARDKASMYAGLGMKGLEENLDDKQKEAFRKEMRDRFQPAACAMPNTLTGLASLANERIEDAIARGQFKNIPRGKGVERDTRGDNPFVDTTEYIMNKMIKRQEIVPPWIEKQQELAKAAHVFRARLRSDWKRHAARVIASKGGSLQDQMDRARRYAKAEEVHNPRKRNVDQIAVPTNSTDDVVMVKIRQQPGSAPAAAASESLENDDVMSDTPLPPPFRDPDWWSTEQSYMNLAINNINSITRSYNLMAPELAKKPYFNLKQELSNCYADIAPQLADAIKDRATRPSKPLVDTAGDRPGSILDRFGSGGRTAKVFDSKAPHYGFKEMWRDIWGGHTS